MKKLLQNKLAGLLLIFNGAVCLLFQDHVYNLLPTLCGVILLMEGVLKFMEGIKVKSYRKLEENQMETSLMLFIVGLGVLWEQQNALFTVGIFWGLWGMVKAIHSLNHGLYHYHHDKPYLASIAKAIVECVLSTLLIFDPFHNIHHHILILGVELIFEGCVEIYAHSTAKPQYTYEPHPDLEEEILDQETVAAIHEEIF